MRTANEKAVSPVVGVMLMLVVVIIIAAIVSGFAGSLAQSNNKAPQASIQGTLYVNGTIKNSANLVKIKHMGGDELVTAKIQILIRKGDDWGPYQTVINGNPVLNKSLIHDSTGLLWLNITDGSMPAMVWRPGETMYYDGGGYSSSDIGKTLVLEIDTNDGKLISKTMMPIVA